MSGRLLESYLKVLEVYFKFYNYVPSPCIKFHLYRIPTAIPTTMSGPETSTAFLQTSLFVSSVTRLGNLLDFGQLFKAFVNN